MAPRPRRSGGLGGLAAVLALAALAGCSAEHDRAGRLQVARPLAVLPVERLRARPAPLDAPESYLWTDRLRFRSDLERHVADLYRQAVVLRHGLRSGAGAAPRETLIAIREAEEDLIVELARLSAATAASWPRVRLDVLEATVVLARAIDLARRAASPGSPAITM
jgi:hypothetical protein